MLLAFPLACGETHSAATNSNGARIDHVVDGDTVVLEDGRHVRLVEIDAPELPENECYAREAERALEAILPPGAQVVLQQDPALDKQDRFGRTLAYALKDTANVNVELVREGAAAPYFFRGGRGRYANELLLAAQTAQHEGKGLWGACPQTVLDPYRQVDARP